MIKLTSKRHPNYSDLRQVKALEDIPHLNVKKGDLGGYVHKDSTLQGQCWVNSSSVIRSKHIFLEDTTLHRTMIHADARGPIRLSTLTDTNVTGANGIYLSQLKNVSVSGSDIESSNLSNFRAKNITALRADLSFEHSAIVENAIIRDGHITDLSQIHSVHPIGSEDSIASVYPGLDGTPMASVGCWTGLLSHLPEEVSDRIYPDGFYPEEYERYHAQYKAFQIYAEAITKTWRKP